MLAFQYAYLTNRTHERKAKPVANGVSAKQKRCPRHATSQVGIGDKHNDKYI